MRAWMIPWLLPAAILVLVLAFALTPDWVAGIVFGAVLVGALLGWRAYDGPLPGWMSGWRR